MSHIDDNDPYVATLRRFRDYALKRGEKTRGFIGDQYMPSVVLRVESSTKKDYDWFEVLVADPDKNPESKAMEILIAMTTRKFETPRLTLP